MIKEELAAGRDPHNKEVMGGAGKIDLYKLGDLVHKAKAEAMQSAAAHENECDKKAVPNWVGETRALDGVRRMFSNHRNRGMDLSCIDQR